MITLEQAKKLAEMAREVDGGCHICAKDVCLQLNTIFPEFQWVAVKNDAYFEVRVKAR